MTDERDPRLTENGLDGEDESLREHRGERIVQRAPSGRFPAINGGRMPAQGRFTQTGMPAVPRVGMQVSPQATPPAVPHTPSTTMPPTPGNRWRTGRPGIVGARGTRPVIHAQDTSHAEESVAGVVGQETPEISHVPNDVLNEVPVEDAMAALEDVFEARSNSQVASSDEGVPFNAEQEPGEKSDIESRASFEAPVDSDEMQKNLNPSAEDSKCDTNSEASSTNNASNDFHAYDMDEDESHAVGASDDADRISSADDAISGSDAVAEEVESTYRLETKSEDSEKSDSQDMPVSSLNATSGDSGISSVSGVSDVSAVSGISSVSGVSDVSAVAEEDEESMLLMTDIPVQAPETEAREPEISSDEETLNSPFESESHSEKENVEAEEDSTVLEDASNPIDNGPAFELKPIPPELCQEQSLRDNSAYRKESRSLLRTQNWNDLVQLMENVLQYAVWADLPEVRSSILKELASIYLDKINDEAKARTTYLQLLRESPSNETALAYMEDEYRKSDDYKAIHDMYRRVVDVTWDSDERVNYTRKAAEIAEKELNKPSLAIADWEHLWQIGETGEEVQNSLMAAYRAHESWEKLAAFIKERCVDWKTTQDLGLREAVEIYISGMGDAEKASATLSNLLAKHPSDPLLLLENINVCRISGDIDQLAQISRVKCDDVRIERDLHRAAAEVLWDKGERELAVQAYDSILEDLPNDRDALHIKEIYYDEGGHHEQLCSFYEQRADSALEQNDSAQAIAFYAKAADVAEKQLFDNEHAISLLKRIIDLDPNDAATYQRIIALYESIGDDQGVANAMEALLAITSRPALRTELLSKLGLFYLDHLSNFEKAEACWKNVQAIDPLNPEVSEELSRVYAKQGDYEALDKSLTQQIRIASDDTLQHLADKKAKYLSLNSPSSPHTAASWEIVLDCDPNNAEACEQLANVLDKLSRNDEMIGVWEQELSTLTSIEERIALGLRIADACVENAPHTQAVSAYLRILCWNPLQDSALASLEAICTDEERIIVRAVLEVAAAQCESNEKRCELLKRSMRFIKSENISERLILMQRLLQLNDTSIEPEFVALCRSEHRSEILVSTWLRRASETEDLEERDKLLVNVARVYAQDLDDATRAFTILFAASLDTKKAEQLAIELENLAPQTNRWEEVVAVYNCLASTSFDAETRKHALEKSIEILIQKLNDPARALHAYNRLLAINPDDAQLLETIENLTKEKNLLPQLLSIYGELWDKTQNISLRAEIADKRHAIYKELSKDELALGELFIAYRLMPTSEIAHALENECENTATASVCVSLLESEKLAADALSADSLKRIAKIYSDKISDLDAAFALYCMALTHSPNDAETLSELESLASNESHRGRFAQALRLAASKAHKENSDDSSLKLYRRLANFYKSTLNDLERSIDIERTILRIAPNCIESLEALIAWHEARSEWVELRSELKQRIQAGGSDDERIALWLRIVAISRDRLNDVEGTFDGYAEILQIDESNSAAHEGIELMTGENIGPDVELRKLRLELKLANDEKRPQIMLNIAQLQNDVLALPDAACETLEQLYQLTGPCGIGFEPLCKNYEKAKLWKNLVQIQMEHANACLDSNDEDNAVLTLQEALHIADKYLKNDPIGAQVIAQLQKLDPENEEIIERYCSSLRKNEDWGLYASTIQSLIDENASNTMGRKSLLFELARIKSVALNDYDGALEMYREINRSGGVEKNAYFGIATLALKKGDIDLYLKALDQVLRLLDPAWGAIFYCHMAEVCDEKNLPNQVAVYYRSARALDPDNAVASDSLRSIGRRLKNWRATSAILPVENERELSWHDRSRLLLAKAQETTNPNEARQWLWKAIAVDHDNGEAWQNLAKIEQKAGHIKACYEATFGAYGAVERTTLPGPNGALCNAQSLFEVSQIAREAGNDAKAEALLQRAYALAPGYAPIAIAVGDSEQDSGNIDKAYTIYDSILSNKNITLDNSTLSELYFKRGLIANIQQNYPQALDDLRTTVKMSPLHYEALMTISKTYADLKQPLLALAALQQALIVTDNKTKRRGNIYYDMGKIWSDDFNDHDEAGIYYEGALINGASNVDLIERSLEIYKRNGRYHEALELADTLTKTTTNPAILASLWCTKGELSESISSENATEAYDMALSYAPGMARAFDGLERMLVARGEYAQLADLLNGRLEGEHSKEREAAILLKLADLYAKHLDQNDKAADILYKLLECMPSADVVSRLLALPQNDESKKRTLFEKAILYCNGSYQYALELAQIHLQQGRDLQAWAIMSPLRTLLQLDAQTKETLNELKNKFEKSDAVPLDSLAKALPILSDEQFAILDALKSVAEHIAFGPKSLDEITSGASEVSENTPNGKIFSQLRAGMGLENIALYRSAELPEAIVVVQSDPLIVCLRTEIFQKAAGNELQFWLAKAIALAHPDMRCLASAPANIRAQLPMAILSAVGIGDATTDCADLSQKIKNALSPEQIKDIHSQLTLYPEDKLLDCAKSFAQDMMGTSDLMGAYIVADMRTVWRAESRIDENITEQRNVKTIDDIAKALDASAILRRVLAYYVSDAFSEQLAQ